ncbi:thioesterase II family protein [Sorangium sp. So ce362]|uniref:thioesterase II family protein n=1 Tax=Sorangium sp. So ce362 TaxID=3133303 RepID=UPI003F5F4E28
MRPLESADRWLVSPRPAPEALVQLLFFPYAGAGTSVYHGWAEALPPWVEGSIVRLPGRETRLREPPLTTLRSLVRALSPALSPRLTEPFAFFGHSMGALIAFELARQLRRERRAGPAHLFVSARPAPQLPPRHEPLHALSDDEFLDLLARRYQGVPETIRREPELLKLYLPTLRADFSVLETATYEPEEPLDCRVSAFGGRDDETATEAEIAAWCRQTRGDFSLRMFPGDHFFLHGARTELLDEVTEQLTRALIPT